MPGEIIYRKWPFFFHGTLVEYPQSENCEGTTVFMWNVCYYKASLRYGTIFANNLQSWSGGGGLFSTFPFKCRGCIHFDRHPSRIYGPRDKLFNVHSEVAKPLRQNVASRSLTGGGVNESYQI